MATRRTRPDLPSGTLEMLILRVLAKGSAHGYGVLRGLREASDEQLVVQEGVLYPALHRLERRKAVRAEWGRSENGRRARFYSITAAGRRRLEAEVKSWRSQAALVDRVLDAARMEVTS